MYINNVTKELISDSLYNDLDFVPKMFYSFCTSEPKEATYKIEPMKPTVVIFLDKDGVLNCEAFYEDVIHEIYNSEFKPIEKKPLFRQIRNYLVKLVKSKKIERLDYYKSEVCPKRIQLFNDLCKELNAVVVISASIRANYTVEQLQEIFDYCGGTFKIIGKTGNDESRVRGKEINQWIYDNMNLHNYRTHFVIIDDGSDFLQHQSEYFFQTDSYTGLNTDTCFKIKRYINNITSNPSNYNNEHIELPMNISRPEAIIN